MTIFERIEHWFNCRKIELSFWLKDPGFKYYASWNEEKGEYQMVKVSPIATKGTPEWDKQQAEMKAIREREERLCALDPAYKAAKEKKHAAYIAKAEAEIDKIDPEIRRIIELKKAKSRAELSK